MSDISHLILEISKYLDFQNEKIQVKINLKENNLIFFTNSKKWIIKEQDYYKLFEISNKKILELIRNFSEDDFHASYYRVVNTLNNKKFRKYLNMKSFW